MTGVNEPTVEPADSLLGFADADWAGDEVTRRSVSGFVFMLCFAAISWVSQLQRIVTLSSTEAEYVALTTACTECIYLRGLMGEMGLMQKGPTVVFEDNQGAIALVKNQTHGRRSRHIDIRYKWISEKVRDSQFVVSFISTKQQLADMFTKGLQGQVFVWMRNKVMGISQ
jgi:hypothetical protein